MDIDEILSELQKQIDAYKEMRDTLLSMEEENRRMAARVNAWFAMHGSELPEVPRSD